MNPQLPNVHEAIGNNLLRLARTREALTEFEAELQLQPRSATAHLNIARALVLLGDDGNAERLLPQALALDRPPPETYKLLGKIGLHRHDYRLAVDKLTRYVSAITDDASAYYMLLQAYRSDGNAEGARRALLLYQKTSLSTKDRTNAQKTLEEVCAFRKCRDD